ncbi:hypothetical protein [Phytohabitans aurantiacus]|uniref:Transposase (putative) YhgA-like domain-containing protein n=1 Tax=Phytohabitans aurantiacus TaxID=3016789 RepID=A0ABQ5QN11_9ACTN|nr:hypothetical protein [Phytohabitans aurantiacus]GLH95660.1 hypothetical protein Pa4123_09320 [Phytohabitans aurantiacus]
MPSVEHETPIDLLKLDPTVGVWLLANVFDVKVPDYHHAHPEATDMRVLVPRTFHADGVLVYRDAADKPQFAVVFEVQRRWDIRKRRTWKLYTAQIEAELDVDAALLVLCPDPAVARRYRDLFAGEGLSLSLRPFIFTPDDVPLVVDVALARAKPALAVFSAICHLNDPEVEAAFPALAEALRSLGPTQASTYYDVVLSRLPVAARTHWEAFMSTAMNYEFKSDFARHYVGLGKAEGKAEGEARAVLTVLEGRGVAVPDDVREQILGCTDLDQLDTWLRRAGNATTIDDVISV